MTAETKILEKDYPNLYQASDYASKSAQSNYQQKLNTLWGFYRNVNGCECCSLQHRKLKEETNLFSCNLSGI